MNPFLQTILQMLGKGAQGGAIPTAAGAPPVGGPQPQPGLAQLIASLTQGAGGQGQMGPETPGMPGLPAMPPLQSKLGLFLKLFGL